MENHQQMKEELLRRRKEIVERLGRVENHLRHTDKPLEADFAEQAIERANDEVLEVLDENMRNEVIQIDHAIELMEKGDYGICQACQNPIAQKRLEALPYTSICINCAS
ncbi:MAG TPA: TraR/DksA C4-type zinc finger protein [Pyrinomonadaceae bacterium]|nr:TraR/DksA C4-type zinc finger protein [Pyrinomonadaceae bacterium]